MRHFILLTALVSLWHVSMSQVPVEVLAGDKRMTFDLMFFKFFTNKDGANTPLLFFSRERATTTYDVVDASVPPQFGFTEALSFNHPGLKGWAPVVVGQVLNSGTYAKAGIQYVRITPKVTFFGWTVAELRDAPNIDLFMLLRYTPPINHRLHLYTQLELSNAFPTSNAQPFTITQRLRLGIQSGTWQFGFGGDYTAFGRGVLAQTGNSGMFLRHVF